MFWKQENAGSNPAVLTSKKQKKEDKVLKKLIALCILFSLLATPLEATVGVASYYETGRVTANGSKFDPNAFTAAHRRLPFGTYVLVTNLHNNQSVIVQINDRGPFVRGREIDLSRGAAEIIGMRERGITRVRLRVVGNGP